MTKGKLEFKINVVSNDEKKIVKKVLTSSHLKLIAQRKSLNVSLAKIMYKENKLEKIKKRIYVKEQPTENDKRVIALSERIRVVSEKNNYLEIEQEEEEELNNEFYSRVRANLFYENNKLQEIYHQLARDQITIEEELELLRKGVRDLTLAIQLTEKVVEEEFEMIYQDKIYQEKKEEIECQFEGYNR